MKKAIFYEGDYDLKVLQKVLEGLRHPVMPIRAGSKYGMKSFIQGYIRDDKRVLKLNDSEIIAFRDRDFDFPVPEQAKLIAPMDSAGKPDKKIRVSYRTTIENYLLTPVSLFVFCQTHPLYHSLFGSEVDAKYIFDKAAENILAYQAARHALGAIRVINEQKTKLTADSGILPMSLAEDFCRDACKSLIKDYSLQNTKYSEAEFDYQYDKFLYFFRKPLFMQQTQYEIYFHGKDLQAALSHHLPEKFPFKTFYNTALQNFDYTQYFDLIELRTQCELQN